MTIQRFERLEAQMAEQAKVRADKAKTRVEQTKTIMEEQSKAMAK